MVTAGACRTGWIFAGEVAIRFSGLAATGRARAKGQVRASGRVKGQAPASDQRAAGLAQDSGLRNQVQNGRQAATALRSGLRADAAAMHWEISDRAESLRLSIEIAPL